VALVLEDACVNQLELRLLASASSVLLDDLRVRELTLRVLIERPHVRVSRGAVQVEVVLLDVLAVVALGARQAEQPFLQNRVLFVPERQGEADPLVAVADAEEAVLVPAIDPRARVIVGEVVPGSAERAVIFPDRAPCPVAQVGPPSLPVS